jgi:hypothetical protein
MEGRKEQAFSRLEDVLQYTRTPIIATGTLKKGRKEEKKEGRKEGRKGGRKEEIKEGRKEEIHEGI